MFLATFTGSRSSKVALKQTPKPKDFSCLLVTWLMELHRQQVTLSPYFPYFYTHLPDTEEEELIFTRV